MCMDDGYTMVFPASQLGCFRRAFFDCRHMAWARRCIVTHEPPFTMTSMRPCTVVLTEDRSKIEASWHDVFLQDLPNKRGLEYGYLEVKGDTLQERLRTFEQELAALPSVVLVARGPLVSWLAQYYLESSPLAGLVMVDPIDYDALHSHPRFRDLLEVCHRGNESDRNFVDRILRRIETRPLKLEPGPVPMLVIQSSCDSEILEMAHEVARRHSDADGTFGDVPIRTIRPPDSKGNNDDAIEIICNWIDDVVL